MIPKDLSNVVLATHKGCLDGAGCVLVFLASGGKRENVRYIAAGMFERFVKDLERMGENRFVIFADVSVPNQKYADKLEKRGSCFLLDHHQTSSHLQGRDWCVVDLSEESGGKCGCLMLAEALHVKDEDLIDLCRLIDDHDRWKLRDARSARLASLLVFLGQEEFITRFSDRVLTERLFTLEEERLLDVLDAKKLENAQRAVKMATVREVDWGDGEVARVAYTFAHEQNTSFLMNYMLANIPDIDVAAHVNLDRRFVSLRSNGYDVAKMASYFGGGGHVRAAGHSLTPRAVQSLLEETHA